MGSQERNFPWRHSHSHAGTLGSCSGQTPHPQIGSSIKKIRAARRAFARHLPAPGPSSFQWGGVICLLSLPPLHCPSEENRCLVMSESKEWITVLSWACMQARNTCLFLSRFPFLFCPPLFSLSLSSGMRCVGLGPGISVSLPSSWRILQGRLLPLFIKTALWCWILAC